MSYTETVEEHLKISDWRIYLDSGSSQYNKTGIQDKLETQASVVYHKYDLAKIIEEYKTDYCLPGYKHIYDNLSGTLIELMSFLKAGNITDHKVRKQFEEESQAKVISELILLLEEKIIPQFSIEKLVLSYIDYKYNAKAQDYKRQSSFFQIDFNNKNIVSSLKQREQDENVTIPTYVNLFDFLHSMFERIKDINSDWLPEMGMSLLQLWLCKKHLPDQEQQIFRNSPQKLKQRLIEFAIDLVEIVYTNKTPMINPWYRAKQDFFNREDNFIHPDESDLIEAFNASLKGEDKEKYKIHTEIAPVPFYGNVFTADILLLSLNPGFDYEENKKDDKGKNFYETYRECYLKGLTHEKIDMKYPLLFLDKEYAKRSPYWDKRLKSLYQNENEKERFGNRVCKIQYFPYVSLKFKDIPQKFFKKKIRNEKQFLKTQEYSFYLVRKAIERNAIIIITRSGRLWREAIPELETYTNKYYTVNPRNPYISPKNLPVGYKIIKEALSN